MTSQQRVRVVVIGGGMAAARLAQRLRPADAGGGPALTVLGAEPHAPYNRVLLAEVLAGRYAPEVIALPAPHDGVRWLSGVRAVRIDRATRTVLCDDGRAVPYDRLVLATGSNPVLPPLRGLFPSGHGDLPDGVHPFRTLDDCTALAAAAARPGVRAVVIGGGLLGVSAARALAERGVSVLLAQQGEHLMERQLDAGAAALLRAHIEALGVEVHTECRVRGLRVEDGSVRGVELADGYVPDADVVVLACGVRPRTGLARAAGLPVDRGIVVDDELRTADPRIHAIGDCAQHDGVVYGLAGAALEQADLLARVLSEEAARYRGTRALTRLTLTGPSPGPDSGAHPSPGSGAHPGPGSGAHLEPDSGAHDTPLDLAAFGTPSPRPGDDVIHLSDATRSAYRKVIVRGDRLVGGILLGDLGAVGTLARTWEADDPLPDAPLLHLLTTDRPIPDGGF
ncbi:nitrite reductase [Streptomyces chrestomyceticus JCM 4735]|uniref:Nitrite reductase n=1 Tax=Streptomyces chrestomyceticus JCM 4735 TaxID=1306181 RepID=A0A7U9KYK0_9ACTN|nr:FAD-dependent oxidoreductase [Streptomyces chrestomyceticus]GCD37789.1 nitrite reductase [Streptomyces chrestomyceticus JCM 4735]